MENEIVMCFVICTSDCSDQTFSADPPAGGGLVSEVADLAEPGVAFAGVLTPTMTGTYWFEIAYPFSSGALDAKIPGGVRGYGQPYHEAFGGLVRLRVREELTGRAVVENGSLWTPMESSASDGRRTCADRLDAALVTGVTYDVRLEVERGAPILTTVTPRFVVEPAHETRKDFLAMRLRWIIPAAGLGLVIFAWVFRRVFPSGANVADGSTHQG